MRSVWCGVASALLSTAVLAGVDASWNRLPTAVSQHSQPDTTHNAEAWQADMSRTPDLARSQGLALRFDLALSSPSSRATADEDGKAWEPVIYGPGFTREVMTSLTWDDGSGASLYVGGQIMTAGPHQALGIARWDGEQWNSMGVGLNGPVRDMVVYQNQLIVAGDFTRAADKDGRVVEVNNIARWDGQRWHAVGSGFRGPSPESARVLALAVHEGDLIAGGAWFPDSQQSSSWIARWDGTQWNAFGSSLNQTVWDLAVYQGQLIAAGNFTEAGGSSVGHVAAWNGSDWQGLGVGMNRAVIRLAAGDNHLYAGGVFDSAGGSYAGRVARWDGNSWTTLGSGLAGTDQPMVRSMRFVEGQLYIGGVFTHAGGMPMNHIGRWDGSSWHRMEGPGEAGVGGVINGVDVQMDGAVAAISPFEGHVVAAGMFYTAGGERSNYIAQWHSVDGWSSLPEPGSGLINLTDINNGPARALVQYGGDLIAGGGFDDIGHGLPSGSRIAGWNGDSWFPLGNGIDGIQPAYGQNITALAEVDGHLYMGGSFSSVDGVSGTRQIARWDGSQWHALGNGVGQAPPGALANVETIAAYQDGIVAGGTFLDASGTAVSGIAYWDGSNWATLGQGTNGSVMAAVEFQGDLIAAGQFNQAGGVVVNGIARWDGSQWHPLGGGMNNSVLSLAIHDGALYAGGNFTQAGGVSANHVARWDGNQWHALDSGISGDFNGLSPRVWALSSFDGDLYAAGLFEHADGGGEWLTVNNVARWDGERWWPLSGPNGTGLLGEPSHPWAFSMTVFDAPGATPPRLVVGGYHLVSGGVASWGMGFYGKPSLAIDTGEIDFGAVEVGSGSASRTITLTSHHSGQIAVQAIQGANAEITLSGGSCGAPPFVLAEGATCTLTLTFSPTVVGPYNDILFIDSDLPAGRHRLRVSGQGTEGALGVWPQSLDFGPRVVGSTPDALDMELINAGSSVLTVSSFNGPNAPFQIEPSACGAPPFDLQPQQACRVSISYSPAVEGSHSDTFELNHDAGDSVSVPLSGSTHARSLSLDTGSIDFGDIQLGSLVTQSLNVSNTGGIDVTLSGWSNLGAPFSIDPSGCGMPPVTLSPGNSCELVFSFAPTSVGQHDGNLVLESNAPESPSSVDLTGQASGARLSLVTTELTAQLGPDASSVREASFSNAGNLPLAWQVSESPSATGLLLRTTATETPDGRSPGSSSATGLSTSPLDSNVSYGAIRYAVTGGNDIALTHSASMQPVAGTSVACGGFGVTEDNRFLRVFELDSFGLTEGFRVEEVTFGIESLNARVPITVNLYSLSGEMSYSNLTLLDSHSQLLAPAQLTLVDYPFDVELPPRDRLVVEIEAAGFGGLAGFWPGTNAAGQSAPSWWSSDGCGESEPVTLSEIGQPDTHLIMQVSGDAPFNCALPPWIEASVPGGSLDPGQLQNLDVTLDAEGLVEGSYRANLCLESNDGISPVTAIPVLLDVARDQLFRDRFE